MMGSWYIAVFSDYLTRFLEAFVVPSIGASTIADLLVNEIMVRHGAPRTQLSDRGSNFLSSLVKEVCYLMDTEKVLQPLIIHNVMGLWRDLMAPSRRVLPCMSVVTRKTRTNI